MSVGTQLSAPFASSSNPPVPQIQLIEPTPIQALRFNSILKDTASPLAVAPSHRVLYRGSLSFSLSNADIPLEGACLSASSIGYPKLTQCITGLGICIVAHFDNSSPTRSSLLSSPLPLALESQRGRSALNIISVIPTASIEDRIDDTLDLRLRVVGLSLPSGHTY